MEPEIRWRKLGDEEWEVLEQPALASMVVLNMAELRREEFREEPTMKQLRNVELKVGERIIQIQCAILLQDTEAAETADAK